MGAGGTALGDRGLARGYHAIKDGRGYAGLAELKAVNRAARAGDLAGGGRDRLAGLGDVGDRGGRAAAGIVGAKGFRTRRAGFLADAILALISNGAFNMAPAPEQIGAGRHIRLVRETVLIGRNARIELVLDAAEILVEDEVDHPGDGVGTVDRRGAAGDHVDAAHQRLRQGADIDAAVLVGGRKAHAVQQDQGSLLSEIAQVEEVAAGVAGRAARVALGRAVDENRQLVQGVPQVGGGGGQQLLGADGGDGRRRVGDIGDDARAGDGHAFHIGLCLRAASALRAGRIAEQAGEQRDDGYGGF